MKLFYSERFQFMKSSHIGSRPCGLTGMLLCALLLTLAGCTSEMVQQWCSDGRPNWSAGTPELLTSPVAGRYQTGAVRLTLYNNADCAIERINIRFGLFDRASGLSAIPGTGLMEAVSDATIEAGSRSELEISLDPWLYQQADPAWLIDYLHFPEIRYRGGARWRDPFAVWRLRGKED